MSLQFIVIPSYTTFDGFLSNLSGNKIRLQDCKLAKSFVFENFYVVLYFRTEKLSCVRALQLRLRCTQVLRKHSKRLDDPKGFLEF